MKIIVKDYQGNILNLMRKLHYRPDKKKNTFSRSIGSEKFPRYHIYYDAEKRIINLHLDQKSPRYQGVADHSAEYYSEPVKREANRIKLCLQKN